MVKTTIGGHTRPSARMLSSARPHIQTAIQNRRHGLTGSSTAWDATRLKVQAKADQWRRQGFIGPTMASHAELAYTGIVDSLAALGREFELPVAPQPPVPAPAVSR